LRMRDAQRIDRNGRSPQIIPILMSVSPFHRQEAFPQTFRSKGSLIRIRPTQIGALHAQAYRLFCSVAMNVYVHGAKFYYFWRISFHKMNTFNFKR